MICDLRLETRNATLPREIGFTGVEEAVGGRRRRSATRSSECWVLSLKTKSWSPKVRKPRTSDPACRASPREYRKTLHARRSRL